MNNASEIIFPDEFELPDTPTALTVVPQDTHVHPWSSKLLFDLALGIDDLETILTRHALPVAAYSALCENPHFRRDLVVLTKELQESGVSFKRKAALQAEMYLEDMDNLMREAATPPSVKKDIFIHMAKLGELEPEKKTEGSSVGAAFNIQINL